MNSSRRSTRLFKHLRTANIAQKGIYIIIRSDQIIFVCFLVLYVFADICVCGCVVFRWSHVFVDVIVINMMMPDLTSDGNNLNQSFVTAAATVSCLEVLSPVLTVLLMFMSDTYVNRHKETLCLAAAYIVVSLLVL